jgi:hypothetical protein
MEIFVSIDGVLRNTVQKFDYHYKDYFLNTESEEKETFEYKVKTKPLSFQKIMDSYSFQSVDEFIKFLYFDFPIEIFGHAGLSYSQTATDLNKLIIEHPNSRFTLIGLNEKGKAKSASLFFISKNGIMMDQVIFSNNSEIDNLWKKCDVWITEDFEVIEKCPKNKKVIKFNTYYNNHYKIDLEISKLSEINKLWLKFSEKTILSMLMGLLKRAKQVMKSKMKTAQQLLK